MLPIIKKYIKKLPLSTKTRKSIRRALNPARIYLTRLTTNPLSSCYGFDRGKPLDRFYIERFIEENSQLIRGACLEVLNNRYTSKYGGDKVEESDVLDIDESNKNANIIADLRNLNNISNNTYDCIILTQVLQFIDDSDAVISECYRILKKGGVLLATLPCLGRIDCAAGTDNDYWRFTKASTKYLFKKKFSSENLKISAHGNVRSGIYFYSGLAQEDVTKKILLKDDPDFPLIITVKATK